MLETKQGWDGLSPFIASDWLARQSVLMPRNSDPFKTLCYRIRQAALQALETIRLRTEGVPVASPAPLKVVAPKAKQFIADLIEPWKIRQKPKDASIREFDRAVARFNEKHPDLAVCDIESVHIVEYRDWLTGQGLAAATVEKHMNAIKALLGIAVERNLIKYNPASKIKPPKASKTDGQDREPFRLADLKLIFSSPVYRGQKIPKGGKGEAAYWLPLMALFSGAREEELCQLRLDDLREEEGVLYWLIQRKHKEQDTKTDGSIRRTPIHPELIRLGLLDYVQDLRDRREEWLFPLLVPDVKGNRSGNWSKWFHRYLRETVKITDPALVFHSFRHTFKDVCRECSIPEDVHDALTGHKNASVSRSYGSGFYPLLPLVDAINRFGVRGLDLSEVISPPNVG
ncbi:phage integrase SAM-like domain-containing protein [Neopusillimonas aromaticivorans]|uniref:phage integrase SAM-like domain-containing protein n=1 Tax=Neopusillimonas aromaticivorans TaxID=2979868 RepID=UPI0025986159|nr:phage integrase SAM-like domain-containing protein [Neopusillimonas aromaticivorans]WJJ94955.1 phage integrase SAM-like domain-containing protein [Neopusillimonas aromaticivorans]